VVDSDVEKIRKNLFDTTPGIFSKHPVLFAYLYGSYATGIVHPFSDLDVGVYIEYLPESRHLELELSLSLELDNVLDGAVASEIRIINKLPLVILGNIVTEGVLIYSRDEILRVDFETSVRNSYFDFLPVIHRYNRAYLDRVRL